MATVSPVAQLRAPTQGGHVQAIRKGSSGGIRTVDLAKRAFAQRVSQLLFMSHCKNHADRVQVFPTRTYALRSLFEPEPWVGEGIEVDDGRARDSGGRKREDKVVIGRKAGYSKESFGQQHRSEDRD